MILNVVVMVLCGARGPSYGLICLAPRDLIGVMRFYPRPSWGHAILRSAAVLGLCNSTRGCMGRVMRFYLWLSSWGNAVLYAAVINGAGDAVLPGLSWGHAILRSRLSWGHALLPVGVME